MIFSHFFLNNFFFFFNGDSGWARASRGKGFFLGQARAHDGEREVTAQSNFHTALVVEEFVRYHAQVQGCKRLCSRVFVSSK